MNSVLQPRRQFLQTVTLTSLALAAAPQLLATNGGPKRRYAIVGTGSRSRFFQNAIEKPYAEFAELVAFCDTNPGRMKFAQERSVKAGAKAPKAYAAGDFETMVRTEKPEVIIVTTPDATHDDYIVKSLELGCDVITEKPMTTTPEKCQRIVDAVERTGREVRVAFNYRYSPPRTQIKELLMAGEIGDVLSVDFQWNLNTHHGADYFRRWHGEKKNSGGLLVHKSTHHFDLVNWWLSAVPEHVTAFGKREFYTPTMAKRLGLASHHERCRTCPEKAACGFRLDLASDPMLKAVYLEQEHHDGYFRDQCIFNPRIDIEDTMNVLVSYDTGATLNYSLNAFASWEGYTIAFNGTKGRLEHTLVEQVYISGTAAVQGATSGVRTRLIPLRGSARDIEPASGEGGHGGGDPVLLHDLFHPEKAADPTLRASNHLGGAWSILVGAAANRSMTSGQRVYLKDLVSGLAKPAYAPMPNRQDPVPMPAVLDPKHV